MDRISELPLHVIHQIMSHLSRKEVARTNLLSKTWKNNLRPSFPILAFNDREFAIKSLPQHCKERWSFEKLIEPMEEFTGFVDTTLHNFCKMNLRMLKFQLLIGILSNFDHGYGLINKWIGIASENQVEDLDLSFWFFTKGLYPLPESLFTAKSIIRLSLCTCKLIHPNDTAFRFPSLSILKLKNVTLDALMIHKLTSGSPLLEDYTIWNCRGFEHCHLPKLERLKTLVIYFGETIPKDRFLESMDIDFEAANLRCCTIDIENRYTIGSSSIKGLFNCQHMRKLRLRGNLITEQPLGDFIPKIFPLLEEFWVESSTILRSITIASQRLKQLNIRMCEGLEAIHIDTPNLRLFSFHGSLVPTALTNAPCPGQFCIYNDEGDEVDTLWYLELSKFLNWNSKHESLGAYIQPHEHSYNPEEFRQISSSRPCEVQNLHLSPDIPESEYAAMLDGFLSVCYPKVLSCNTYEERKFSMWLCNEILAQRDAYPYSCDCSYVQCWRHYLKGITQIELYQDRLDGVMVIEPDALINIVEAEDFPDALIEFTLDWCFEAGKA